MATAVSTIEYAAGSRTRLGWQMVVFFSFLFIILALCLWSQSHVVDAGHRVKSLEGQISDLAPRIVGLESELARMKSPSSIKGKLLDNEINMVIPFPEHQVHVKYGPGISRSAFLGSGVREAS